MKSPSEWDEDCVLNLPAHESDTFERKGAQLLDCQPKDDDKLWDKLAKQLSAFANSKGGQIIFGVANDGAVDRGGVTRTVRGQRSIKNGLKITFPD